MDVMDQSKRVKLAWMKTGLRVGRLFVSLLSLGIEIGCKAQRAGGKRKIKARGKKRVKARRGDGRAR
jgi:hypothetical protein